MTKLGGTQPDRSIRPSLPLPAIPSFRTQYLPFTSCIKAGGSPALKVRTTGNVGNVWKSLSNS